MQVEVRVSIARKLAVKTGLVGDSQASQALGLKVPVTPRPEFRVF